MNRTLHCDLRSMKRGREGRRSLIQSPESEALGRAEEGLHRGSGTSVLVNCSDCGCHTVQIQLSNVVEVGRETGSATETLLGRVEVVAEGDGNCVGIIG